MNAVERCQVAIDAEIRPETRRIDFMKHQSTDSEALQCRANELYCRHAAV